MGSLGLSVSVQSRAQCGRTGVSPEEVGFITALVERDVKAAREGHSGVVRPDFLDDARIRGSVDGELVDRSAAEFLAFVDASGATPELAASIVWIDAVGGAAAVRIERRGWHGFRYTDFLSLMFRDGR